MHRLALEGAQALLNSPLATPQELNRSGCRCPSEGGTFCCVEGLTAAILAGTTSLVTRTSVTPASPTGPTMV